MQRMSFISQRVLVLQVAALAILAAAAFAGEKPIALFDGKDLSGWRKPTGDWQAAKAVPLDPADNKKFAIEAGEGVLVNGAKGRTGNLISEMEHGDVEAHIEFVVPKSSNSGVYFMGRYEV